MDSDPPCSAQPFDRHPDFIRSLFTGLFKNPDLRRLVSGVYFVYVFQHYEDFIDFFLAENITSVEAYLDELDPESDQVFTERSHVLLKLCAEYLAEHAPEAPRRNYGSITFDDLQLALAYGDIIGHLGGHYDEGIWTRYEPAEPCIFGVQLLRAVTHVISHTDDKESLAYWKSRNIYLMVLARATGASMELINRHIEAFWGQEEKYESSDDSAWLERIKSWSRRPAFSSFAAN